MEKVMGEAGPVDSKIEPFLGEIRVARYVI